LRFTSHLELGIVLIPKGMLLPGGNCPGAQVRGGVTSRGQLQQHRRAAVHKRNWGAFFLLTPLVHFCHFYFQSAWPNPSLHEQVQEGEKIRFAP
jgi:hypothetical protein